MDDTDMTRLTDQQEADRLLADMQRHRVGSERRWNAFNALENRAADQYDVSRARYAAEDYDQYRSSAETALLHHIRDTGVLPTRWRKHNGRAVELPGDYVESTPAFGTPGDPYPVGDVGADDVVSPAWGRRFVRRAPLDDGTRAVIDVAYYVGRGQNGSEYLCRETTYTRCTDTVNPGDAATWSDVRYDRVYWPETGSHADAVRNACAEVTPDLLTWDGEILTDGETHPVAEDLPDTEL